jgi:inhibitor of KinA sporulation pathway (predicted exonuclease)
MNFKPKINVVSLDLELNQPSNKIIQIGYAIGNIVTKEILHQDFIYVNPEERINPFITELTGIADHHVENAVSLETAYELMKNDIAPYECFINPITWGGGDSLFLREQLGFQNNEYFIFGRRWIDVKTLAIHELVKKAGNFNVKGGLGRTMPKFGLTFEGRKHDAMHDAVNTLRLYFKLLE